MCFAARSPQVPTGRNIGLTVRCQNLSLLWFLIRSVTGVRIQLIGLLPHGCIKSVWSRRPVPIVER